MLTAIIVAAGSSTRARLDKVLAQVAGRPLIEYSLKAFEQTAAVDEIVVVCRPAVRKTISQLITEIQLGKIRAVVGGGERRQDSVQAGMGAVSESAQFIAVHDAARPLITPDEIERVFHAAQKSGAAVLAAPATDTLKLVDGAEFICGSVEREKVYAMQTPQIFSRELLLRAYERVSKERLSVTDEVSAVEVMGARIAVVPARRENMKVTFADDLVVAAAILRQRRAST